MRCTRKIKKIDSNETNRTKEISLQNFTVKLNMKIQNQDKVESKCKSKSNVESNESNVANLTIKSTLIHLYIAFLKVFNVFFYKSIFRMIRLYRLWCALILACRWWILSLHNKNDDDQYLTDCVCDAKEEMESKECNCININDCNNIQAVTLDNGENVTITMKNLLLQNSTWNSNRLCDRIKKIHNVTTEEINMMIADPQKGLQIFTIVDSSQSPIRVRLRQ